METILNLVLSFFTGVGIFCTFLLLLGKFSNRKNYSDKIIEEYKIKSSLPFTVKHDPILHFDKPYRDPEQYRLPDKHELPTDKFKLYYLGEFICEIERKDIKKVIDVYDLEEIKLILNIQ